jgi:hypothetical protein
MDKTEVIQRIIEARDYSTMLLHPAHPQRGQFVSTGPQFGTSITHYVGYCVQVRKKLGAFGSHVVLLRHCDGTLTSHENQMFIPVSESQISHVRAIFEVLPEHEDYSRGFSIGGANREINFVVERPLHDDVTAHE